MSDDDTLDGLRDALRVSPNNVPLRRHLASSLLARGDHQEAEDREQDQSASGERSARGASSHRLPTRTDIVGRGLAAGRGRHPPIVSRRPRFSR